MSTPKPSDSSPIKSSTTSGAESPTTAQPFNMDDDEIQEPGALSNEGGVPRPATVEDEAPPQPPRPVSAQQQAETTLKDAFPSIDIAVVKAVLRASGGRVEPAFNALLGMSDPDAREPTPPPQPPRPQAQRVGSTPLSQLEADEQYARQLAEHYGGGYSNDARSTSRRGVSRGRQQGPQNITNEEKHSFLDDDLPVIKENLRKGFLETQSTVNGWLTNLKKRIDGDEDDVPTAQGYNAGSSAQYRSRRSGDGRQSGDYNRYDADPELLGDDFGGIQLNNDGTPARRSTRPLANPDLFKPTPATPKSSDGRKVAFQSGTSEDSDLYKTSPKVGAKENAPPSGKQSKWQPLSTVDPNPVGEVDNDPFSLGDSEDEKETKDRVGGKEVRVDDAERLKQAAAEAMADSIGEPARKPEPAETIGTKDKIAEETLTGKS